MAIKRHKPEEIVAKLRQVPTPSAGINRPDGPKARHELTINMDQLVGADQSATHFESYRDHLCVAALGPNRRRRMSANGG